MMALSFSKTVPKLHKDKHSRKSKFSKIKPLHPVSKAKVKRAPPKIETKIYSNHLKHPKGKTHDATKETLNNNQSIQSPVPNYNNHQYHHTSSSRPTKATINL